MTTGLWNWDGWPGAEEWSAWWAFCTFAVAGAAAWLALGHLRAYLREQEDRARPYVVVDFAFQEPLGLYVAISNVSTTPATDIRLVASPSIVSTRPAA